MKLLRVGTAASPIIAPMSGYVGWAVALLGLALILFFIEIFVPSGGVIGVAAAAALIAGIVILFGIDTRLGLLATFVALVTSPLFFALAIKLWPNTPIARMLTLHTEQRRELEDADVEDDPNALADPLRRLLGATGQALTDLRPVGTCLINGERTECLAERGVIRAGSEVRVVAVDGMHVKVRQAEEV